MIKTNYTHFFRYNNVDFSGIIFIALGLLMPFYIHSNITYNLIAFVVLFLLHCAIPIKQRLCFKTYQIHNLDFQFADNFINKKHPFFYTCYCPVFFFIFSINYGYHFLTFVTIVYIIRLYIYYKQRYNLYEQFLLYKN